jgi:hypothetical protein
VNHSHVTKREEYGVDEAERHRVLRRRARGEHRKQCEDAHLNEHDVPRPTILASMQFDVQRAVDPGEPDQPEDNCEFDEPAERDVYRELM